MSILENKFTSILSSVALVALATGLTPVRAQELSEDLVDEVDEIVVTGSRLKRSSYNSATPVQIISGEVARELGLFDVTSILQGTSQSSGLQINNSFTSFVLDNGIGAATIGFRGLGAERTLILINGRRLAPAGVGGAPSAPDINMIPAALIERIDNVFDGASAVYGSDAIAGVSNVILRTDIEGIELQTSGSKPASGGGEEFSFTGLYGKSGDNWNISVATTYYERQSQSFAQNDFFNACDEYRFEDESGNLLTQYRGLAPGTTDSSCRLNTTNRVSIRDGIFGNVWSTPGTTNIGIPNFSETVIGPGLAPFAPPGTVTQIDSNGDGILDPEFLIDPDQNGLTEVDIQSTFFNLDRSKRSQSGDLLTGSKLFTVYGTGYYNFQDDNDTELYFEAMYNVRKTKLFSPGSQFFPTVPATNPFNITNPAGQGVNSLNFFGVDFGAFEVIPIISIRGDRDLNDVEVSQKRMLAGIKGNISKFDTFLGGNWSYDVNVGYTTSTGTDVQQGIHDDRLELSLNTTIEDPNSPGTYICGVDNDGDGVPDGTDGCVPFVANAASLFREGGGTFSSQAEADYLFTIRSFETKIEQTVASGIIQGDMFTMPNGSAVPLLLGYEFRRDSILSVPNDIAANGTLFASFTDQGASGTRDLHEFFAETSIQFLKDKTWAEELTLDLGGRVTDESSFDPHFTYSAKLLYRPTSYLTLRHT